MKLFQETIKPFEGTNSFKLYANIDDIKEVLAKEGIVYKEEIWQCDEETIANPWTVLSIEDTFYLFFASNNKLFKLLAWSKYRGKLDNGISLSMSIDEARRIDEGLEYNPAFGIYESNQGYWLEVEDDNKDYVGIAVFIKEIEDEDFDYCKW